MATRGPPPTPAPTIRSSVPSWFTSPIATRLPPRNAASATPSPLKSATTLRITPVHPGNGWNFEPAAVSVPSELSEKPWADPSREPVSVSSPQTPQVQPLPCSFGATETVEASPTGVGFAGSGLADTELLPDPLSIDQPRSFRAA